MSSQTYFAPADRRGLVLPGIPADHTYTFEVQAYRRVDKDIASSGVLLSSTAMSTPYKPTVTPSYRGDIVGSIWGRPAIDVVINLESIASDAVLSTTEKPSTILAFNQLGAQLLSLTTKAHEVTGFDTQVNAAQAAYQTLTNYLTALNPAWNDTAVHTPIVPADFQAAWAGAYAAIADLAAAITGRPGPTIFLSATRTNFTYANGVLTPSIQTATITATVQSLTGTITWTTQPNIKTGTGPSFSLAPADLGANPSVVVTATLGTVSQSVTISKLADSAATAGAPAGTMVGGLAAETVVSKLSEITAQVTDLQATYGDSASAAQAAIDAANARDAAKTYSDAANTAATASQSARDLASGSATDAATQAANAATAANTASTKASDAATQASNAATSASNAATSVINAAKSATDAATAATNASGSLTAAQTQASNASTSATNAASSATAAGTSASNAATAKTAAETARDQAQTALSSANTAFTNADSARVAAQTAKTAAETARDNAQTYASNAQGSANAAAGSATTAATSATNAGTSASAASASQVSANLTAAMMMPDRFSATGDYFTSSTTGAPSAATTLAANATATGYGPVYETTVAANGNTYLYTRGVVPAIPGRIYKVELETQETAFSGTIGSSGAGVMMQQLNASYANTGGTTVFGAPYNGSVQTVALYISDTAGTTASGAAIYAWAAGTTWLRAGARIGAASTLTSVTVQFRRLTITDVTQSNAAQGSANAASTSASSAATSATNAGTSATSAQTSATNASTAAGNASTYATNASTSATNASTQATNAANSASAASTSQGAAATSATNAGNSATAAATSASNASTYATNASNYASAANTSATNAATSAGQASTSATNAATSATNASGSATNASTSATTAATSATAAQSVANRIIPDRPSNKSDFVSYQAGQPDTAAPITLGSVVVDTAQGQVLEIPSTNSIATRGWLAVGSGRVFKVSCIALNTIASGYANVRISAYSASGAYLGDAASAGTNFTTANTWISATVQALSADVLTAFPSAAYVRGMLYGGGSAPWRVAVLRLEDITNTYNAAQSATAAATSASNASTYATNAGTSASSAQTAATNAGTSASNASTYATNASNSATAAGTSASNAANSASAASTSATAANTSAGQASTSASQASTSASNAAGSASDAANSASAANTSATNASTAAGSASTSASQASTSASNAATSATQASNSATAADTSATQASTSASNASTFAGQASTSATNASNSAGQASTSAGAAQTSATNAATSAGQAGTSATNAANSATAAGTSASNASTSASTAASSATQATLTAASMLPSDFSQAGQFWFVGQTGTPSTVVPITANSTYTFPAIAGVGTVLQASLAASQNVWVSSIGAVTAIAGRRYRITVRLRTTTAAAAQARIYGMALNASYAQAGYLGGTDILAWTANTWQTATLDIVGDNVIAAGSATGVYVRASILLNGSGGASPNANTYQVQFLKIEDITDQYNAAQSATAAATSASNAATSATNAGTSATAANTSATNAATSASNANTYATNASNSATAAGTSATNASNSASAASTSATNANTSASNASTSASQASNSATAAGTSASNASTYASAAQTSATNAGTAAGNASTSATQAATSATNAGNSANAASTSAGVAATSATQATLTVAQALPSDFTQGGQFWQSGYTGNPASATQLVANSTYSFVTVSGVGQVLQIALPASATSVGVSNLGVMRLIAGRRYRVAAAVRAMATINGAPTTQLSIAGLDANYAYTAGPSTGALALTTSWQTLTLDFDTTVYTTPVYIRGYVIATGVANGVNTAQLQYLKVEDVTDQYNAQQSASAAATSASNAATSATNAGNSATAASTSATNASTYASNASTSATQASTSATNAANSAGAASTSATAAQTSATNASTYAGNASTSAGQAATSASNAGTYATNASTSATTAANTAAAVNNAVTMLLPDRFDGVGNYFYLSTNPGGAPSSEATAASNVTISGFGPGYQWALAAGNTGGYIFHRGTFSPTAGRLYKVEFEFQMVNSTGTPTSGSNGSLSVSALDSNYTWLAGVGSASAQYNGSVQVVTLYISSSPGTTASGATISAWPSTAVYLRAGASFQLGGATTATVQFRRLTITDVTQSNAAQASANAAATSATNAATSATNAGTSASAAATSATNANTAASNASTYATNASNSATAAGTAAGNAANSASAASTSATNANTSAGNASTYANNASNSATAAGTSASNAAGSASAASTSATNAATAAGNASTSAGQASTSATNAGNSASSAATSASVAANSSNQAIQTAAALFPSDFSQSGQFWYGTTAYPTATAVNPATAPTIVANANFSFATVSGVGQVLQITSSANSSNDVATLGAFRAVAGRRYRATASMRATSSNAPTAMLWWAAMDGTYLYSGSGGTANSVNFPAFSDATTWRVATLDVMGDTILATPNGVFGRFVVRANGNAAGAANASANTYQIQYLKVEDVTDQYNAGQSASAAATSASNAATSATNAGNSASAASTSATNANTAAGNASTYAGQASTSATNAATSASQASGSATAASNSATAASTSAGQASTSASNASTSATNANTSASNASTSASVAATSANQALLTAAQLLPSDFTQNGQFWFNGYTGDPATRTAITTNSTFSFVNVASVGNVLQVAVPAAATSIDFGSIGAQRVIAGRRYRATFSVRATGTVNGTPVAQGWIVGLDSSYNFISGPNSSLNLTTAWQTITLDFDPATYSTAVYVRPLARTTGVTAGVNTVQWRFAKLEDITDQYNAGQSATAAATSASNAATSATNAGNSATAANTSATNAATSASNAGTYASNASTSATNAGNSASQASGYASAASTSATNAATSAGNASSSATSAATSASQASGYAASAQSYMTIAASASTAAINSNPVYAKWTDTGTNPDGWTQDTSITGGSSITRANGENGIGNGVRLIAANGQVAYIAQNVPNITPGGYYMIEADVMLNSGTLVGAGVGISENSQAYTNILFHSETANTTGEAIGNGTTGVVYRFRKLMKMNAATTALYIYMCSHRSDFPAMAGAIDLTWYRCGIRPATDGEIKGFLGYAQVQVQAGVLATLAGRTQAYWQTTVNAGSGAGAFITAQADNSVPSASPITWTGKSSNIGINGRTIQKVSGTSNNWADGVYSAETYTGTAYTSAQAGSTTNDVMFALNSDPATDASYTSLDYAIFFQNGGNFSVWESNTNRGNFGTYTVTDVFSIEYSGTTVTYRKNGVAFLTTTTTAGRTFALDTSFSTVGASLFNVTFAGFLPNLSSTVAIGATEFHVYSPSGSNWKKALSVVGGDVLLSGGLWAGTYIKLGSGVGWPVALATKDFNVSDGDTVSFGLDLANVPKLTFSTNNLAPLNSGETYQLYADNVTSTGFIARLKISTPGTTTTFTLTTDSAPGTGPTRQIDKGSNADANDGNYHLSFGGTFTDNANFYADGY